MSIQISLFLLFYLCAIVCAVLCILSPRVWFKVTGIITILLAILYLLTNRGI